MGQRFCLIHGGQFSPEYQNLLKAWSYCKHKEEGISIENLIQYTPMSYLSLLIKLDMCHALCMTHDMHLWANVIMVTGTLQAITDQSLLIVKHLVKSIS